MSSERLETGEGCLRNVYRREKDVFGTFRDGRRMSSERLETGE